MKALIVIPAYNEAESLKEVVTTLKEKCPEYNYIIINDGSIDNTMEICKKYGYNVIDLPVNLGLSGAFNTGIKYAYLRNYDCAIQFDGDNQHDASYIKPMLEELNKGYDIIIGSRFTNTRKNLTLRTLGSSLIEWAIKITTGQRIKDPTSGMRAFNKSMIKEFANNLNYDPEPDTIAYLIRRGARIKEVQVSMNERQSGESYLNFSKSIFYMFKMGVSILILQFFRKKDSIAKISHSKEGREKR